MIKLREYAVGQALMDASVVAAYVAMAISIFLLVSRIGVIESAIERKTKDRIYKSEIQKWREELQRRNPSLDVPPVE